MPLPRYLLPRCAESPPVGVAIFNGTSDPLVPHDGGQITLFRKKRDVVLATDETVSLWRQRNGCTDDFDREHIERIDDGMHVEKQSRRACRGAPVVLFRIVGGGHTWPSGRQYLPAFIVGKVNRDIDAGTEILAFFRTFN